MKTRTKVMVLGLVMAMVFCYAVIVGAESNSDTGPGASAAVNLDFRIIIPSFIYFKVGSSGPTVDRVDFDPTVDDVTTGTVISASAGTGTVNVVLISNGGQVTITEATTGGGSGLSSTPTDFISWGQIATASSSGDLNPPQLSDAGGTALSITPNSGNFTSRTADWTYTYTNPGTPPVPGTYDGTATYTASIP